MNNLQLIKSENFGTVTCDFYGNGDEFYMTRTQVGTALGYNNPNKAIKDLHYKHRARLDKFSTVLKIGTTDERGTLNGTPLKNAQDTTLYNRKGIMEICRWSQQPKADEFMDWVWDVMDSLIAGRSAMISTKPVSPNELIMMLAQDNIERDKRIERVEESNREISRRVDTALEAFSRPDKDHWKGDVEEKIKSLAKTSGLCEMTLRGRLYGDLERTANVRLNSRVSRLKTRMRKQGHTYRESQAVSKLDAISKDSHLRAIFESTVRQYQAVYSGKEH